MSSYGTLPDTKHTASMNWSQSINTMSKLQNTFANEKWQASSPELTKDIDYNNCEQQERCTTGQQSNGRAHFVRYVCQRTTSHDIQTFIKYSIILITLPPTEVWSIAIIIMSVCLLAHIKKHMYIFHKIFYNTYKRLKIIINRNQISL